MKRIALLLAILIAGTAPAQAAQKAVTVKKLTTISIVSAEAMVVTGKTIVTMSNSDGVNSNILLTGLDLTGIQLWQKTIDSGVDEVALASAVDPLGNIWIAGASSAVPAAESATAAVVVENSDGVVSEPVSKLRRDMNQLSLWKVSPLGELLGTYSLAQSAPPLINAMSVNSNGVSIVGQVQDKPFVLSASSTGVFGKLITIGTVKTQLNAVIRSTDGSASIFGTSSEALAGKKVVGIRDGVLIKVSKTGAVASAVRSSAPKANRSWLAADTTLALTGFVKTGKVIETAFTKFSGAFAPTWTLRVPSLGQSTVLTAGSTTYGAFTSNSSVPSLAAWKPATPSAVILALDGKGLITSAYGSSELTETISLGYSKELGLIGLARTNSQSVSLFKLS